MFFKCIKLNYVSQDATLGNKTIQKRKVMITRKVTTGVNLGAVTGAGTGHQLTWELAKCWLLNW